MHHTEYLHTVHTRYMPPPPFSLSPSSLAGGDDGCSRVPQRSCCDEACPSSQPSPAPWSLHERATLFHHHRVHAKGEPSRLLAGAGGEGYRGSHVGLHGSAGGLSHGLSRVKEHDPQVSKGEREGERGGGREGGREGMRIVYMYFFLSLVMFVGCGQCSSVAPCLNLSINEFACCHLTLCANNTAYQQRFAPPQP